MTVVKNCVGATKAFTRALQSIGLELSDTKNQCLASSTQIADSIVNQLSNIVIHATSRAKSLGGALGAGKFRNAQILKRRLANFSVRKNMFHRLLRRCGTRAVHTVMRTGGVSALTYGQSNMGVSDSMLH